MCVRQLIKEELRSHVAPHLGSLNTFLLSRANDARPKMQEVWLGGRDSKSLKNKNKEKHCLSLIREIALLKQWQ